MNMEARQEEMKVSRADDEPCARAEPEERDAADSEAGRRMAVSAGGDVGWSKQEQQTCAWDLPQDLLAKCFLHLSSMKDMAAASMVSHRWRAGVKAAFVQKERLNFAGFRIDDSSMGRMVEEARNLLELDIHFNRWGSCITDAGLGRIASARCCGNLKSLSLFGLVEVTDKGITQLVSRASSLEHLNIGGTCITDAALIAIASSCTYLKTLGLWGCTNVSETGLLAVVEGCPYLVFLNTECMRLSKSFELRLVSLSPQLRLKPSHLVHLPRSKADAAGSSSSASFDSASYHLHSFVS